MTSHSHPEYVPGCFRCDLSRDEVTAADRPSVPRVGDTITTAEQLDALPSLTIVVDANDEVQQRHGHLATERGDYSAWLGVMPPTCKPSPEVALPVTVLYVPGEPSRPSVTDDALAEHRKGANAEDCPACYGSNPPYPWICPGDDRWAAARAETVGNDGLTDAEREEYARRYRTGPAFQSVRTPLDAGRAETTDEDYPDAEGLAALRENAETTTATTEDVALTIRYATLDDGTVELDEVFADNATVHLEKMDTASWWLGIDVNGEHLAVNLGVDEDGNEFAHAEPETGKVRVVLDGKQIASLYPPGLVTSRPLATARTRPTETEWGARHSTGEVCRHDTERDARGCVRDGGTGKRVVRREVTAWTEAE